MSMKINGNEQTIQTVPKWLQNMKVDDSHQKAGRTLSPEAEKAVQVTLSQEGKDYYRKKLNENGMQSVCYEEVRKGREVVAKASKSLSANYNILLADEADRLKEQSESAVDTIQNHAENYIKAYANLYDEIVKGYKDGTREMYVADEKAEDGYRKMTMEEELEDLEEAYQKAAGSANRLEKADAIIKENAAKIQRIKETGTPAVDSQDKQPEQKENAQDNIGQKMITFANAWKDAYAVSGSKENSMKSIMSLMNNTLKLKRSP